MYPTAYRIAIFPSLHDFTCFLVKTGGITSGITKCYGFWRHLDGNVQKKIINAGLKRKEYFYKLMYIWESATSTI